MSQLNGNEVAIIGMSGRFPGAPDLAAFWQNLCHGQESITYFDDATLRANGVAEKQLADRDYVRSGFCLDGISQFDAEFFQLTPREAQILDPQQRLFLECCWHALEHAGHVPERYDGRIGVYAGVFSSSYLLNIYSQPGLIASLGEMAVRHGNEKDYLTTRLSYKLNLRGPSLAIQTSCSTSLVAVHTAVQSLLAGECDMAISGGVSVLADQETGYPWQTGGLLSPDGHCRPFDADAAGTVFGNGLGVVVLKRLEEAERDGDTVYAVIKGSAINNDGANKVGFTAPSVQGQAEVIAEALSMAEVSAETIQLVEAHGTGTPLGDPVEIEALTRVWQSQTSRKGYCALGSVKGNVGHLGRRRVLPG
ncbi:polyketide synthase [Pectobacterium carotovorum subsp. carotovorum]|nr:polyketide synthase [Pectobacterium carotovorum subsp. carotovorum]